MKYRAALLAKLAEARRLYAVYSADESAVLSGWAAHAFSQWVLIYRELRWHNQHSI